MKKSKLINQAIKDYFYFIHNVNTNRELALKYAQNIYNHALYCGYITETEHKKLCLNLPFETYLK